MVNSLIFGLTFLVPLTFPLIAVVAGVLSGRAEWPDRLVSVGAAAAAVVLAILAATTHAHGVSTVDLVTGVVGAGLVLGALPVWAYFTLGRTLSPHPVLVGFIVVVTAPVVLYVVYVFGWLAVLDFTSCPPDSYECPV